MGQQFPSFLRDSSGYLVDNIGLKLCSVDDFTNILEVDSIDKQLYMGYVQMTGKDSMVTVPAGSFPSITSRMKVIPTQPTDHHPIRYTYTVYGKNIGQIKSHNFFYNTNLQFEGRLMRYKVQ